MSVHDLDALMGVNNDLREVIAGQRERLGELRQQVADLTAERDQWRNSTAHVSRHYRRERDQLAAQAEVIERLTKQVERIRDMHKPIPIYPGDCKSPDDDHEFDPAEEFCRDCPPEFDACGECRDEDGSWIEWPCETALAADPNAWVDDLVRLAAAPTPPAEAPKYVRPMTEWTAFGGKGWQCPKCGGVVAVTRERGPVPCPFGCVIPAPPAEAASNQQTTPPAEAEGRVDLLATDRLLVAAGDQELAERMREINCTCGHGPEPAEIHVWDCPYWNGSRPVETPCTPPTTDAEEARTDD